MITLNKIIYDVRNIRFKGLTADDYNVSDRHIEYWIATLRGKLIDEYARKSRPIPDNFIQDLGALTTECIDVADELCLTDVFPSGLGITVQRTSELPEPIPYINFATGKHNIFTFVGTIAGEHIDFVTPEKAHYIQYSKYGGQMPYAFYKDRRIFLGNAKGMDIIRVRGIFTDPREVSKFDSCVDGTCFDPDGPYPITPTMETAIKDIIRDKYFTYMLQPAVQQDVDNDAAVSGFSPK